MLVDNRVLMVRYRDSNKYDHQQGWFLPDDLLAEVEHPEAAARRVLGEQLDLQVPSITLDHIESFTGGDRSWHLAFHYVTTLDGVPSMKPTADVEEVAWFPVDGLPPRSEMAHGGWGLDVIGTVVKNRGQLPG